MNQFCLEDRVSTSHASSVHLPLIPPVIVSPRCLWLAYERPPHPDAVCHPATHDEVHLVLELLAAAPHQRRQWAGQLRRYLAQQQRLPAWHRPAIPCRRAAGLYVLVPWRLAAWLAAVLPATDGVVERTAARLRHWLDTGQTAVVMTPQV
jgi:hypothetical protein